LSQVADIKGRPDPGRAALLLHSNIRHEKSVWHPLLEIPDHVRLASRYRDRQHIALGGPELDDVGAVVLRAVDHDAVLAGHRCFASLAGKGCLASCGGEMRKLISGQHHPGPLSRSTIPTNVAATPFGLLSPHSESVAIKMEVGREAWKAS